MYGNAWTQTLRYAGPLASTGLVVTWSSGFVGAELSTRANLAPLTVLGWRFVVLAVLLLAVCTVTGTPLRSWRAWRRQAVLGVLCQAGYLICIFEGVHHGVAGGTAALIAALQPLVVATVAGRLLGEVSSPLMWFGMVLGFAGVAVVVSGDLEAGSAPLWAFALPAVGMVSLAVGTIATRRWQPPETLLQSITMQSAVTALALMTAACLAGQAAPPAQAKSWLPIVWLVVLPSLGGYVLYIYVTRTLGATVVSTLLFLTPPTTMLWAFVMFHQQVTAWGLSGLFISSVGVFLVLKRRRSTRLKGQGMAVFRTALVIFWLAIMAVTVHAITSLGIAEGRLFITDFSHPWRAQFNGDFGVYLLLMMAWIVYREGKLWRGLLLAIPVALGSVYALPYIFIATFRSRGRFDNLLLGNRMPPVNADVH